MNILITGGAGFIGVNCSQYFAKKRENRVIVLDDLSREGSEKNLEWLNERCEIQFIQTDIRNFNELSEVIKKKGPFDLILHLAAQVAVTTSVINPREDFEINALGTFNLLEAVRKYSPNAAFIYSSTNKVYGEMEGINIIEKYGRYTYEDLPGGVDEKQNLDFHSPYGCSKGTADQYCIDFARIYGLKTVVMRQSCIYGYRQFGVEDQGWIAWFCIAAATKKSITVYGDGKQVRDVLFIDDLIQAYELAFNNTDRIAGKAFNIGGGPSRILSIHDLIQHLEKLSGKKIQFMYEGWRPGDQYVFFSDISSAEKAFGWQPQVDPIEGVEKLYNWVNENIQLFQ